jgi:hypothetical protein
MVSALETELRPGALERFPALFFLLVADLLRVDKYVFETLSQSDCIIPVVTISIRIDRFFFLFVFSFFLFRFPVLSFCGFVFSFGIRRWRRFLSQ